MVGAHPIVHHAAVHVTYTQWRLLRWTKSKPPPRNKITVLNRVRGNLSWYAWIVGGTKLSHDFVWGAKRITQIVGGSKVEFFLLDILVQLFRKTTSAFF
jgi:hypothetical protein